MTHKRDLVLGFIFMQGFGADLKNLEPSFDDSHIEETRKNKKDMISLDSCFEAFGREELLTGTD